jgi:hypothetical protein
MTEKVFTASHHTGLTDLSTCYHVGFETHNPDLKEKAMNLSGTMSLRQAIDYSLKWGFHGTLYNEFGAGVGSTMWNGTFFLL